MDMEIALMDSVIVIVTGVVNLTVQVTYQANLLVCVLLGDVQCGQKEMGRWSKILRIFW